MVYSNSTCNFRRTVKRLPKLWIKSRTHKVKILVYSNSQKQNKKKRKKRSSMNKLRRCSTKLVSFLSGCLRGPIDAGISTVVTRMSALALPKRSFIALQLNTSCLTSLTYSIWENSWRTWWTWRQTQTTLDGPSLLPWPMPSTNLFFVSCVDCTKVKSWHPSLPVSLQDFVVESMQSKEDNSLQFYWCRGRRKLCLQWVRIAVM